jgi:predicted nuclease of restriction endonuclease-like (RecB) superfamily
MTAPKNKPAQSLESSFSEIVQLIQTARSNAYRSVNTILIDLYWEVGRHINGKIATEAWGKSVVEKLSRFLQRKVPGMRGFSAQNLWRMKQFHDAYSRVPKLSTLLRELPWSANLHILSKCKSLEERKFYLGVATREKWPVREVERQIDSCLFERTAKRRTKLSTTLREIHPNAESVFKDSYALDFLELPKRHSENDLQRGLISDLRRFLSELGKDFCFVGEQYQIQVGTKDFFLDLLFYHRELRCLVAFELKVDDFKPEYLGKMSFYLEALDRKVRKPHEKPSVGVLLCKSKDSEVVEYSLSRTLTPSLVAEYKTSLPDKKLLTRKLAEFYALETSRERNEGPRERRKLILDQIRRNPVSLNKSGRTPNSKRGA